MVRSPAFGSTTYNYIALFTLAFATAPWLLSFNLAIYSNSLDHYAKGTQSHLTSYKNINLDLYFWPVSCTVKLAMVLLPLVSIWFQVLFHSPQRGSFHFSVALLCSLSVAREYLALGGGPPWFTPGFTCPMLLGWLTWRDFVFVYGAFTLFGLCFPT